MSSSPQPQVEGRRLEGARQQLNQILKELTRLAEQDLAPPDFYGPFLQAVLESLAAPAGVVWGRTPQGNLALQYQINFRQVGLDEDDERRMDHDEVLRQAMQQARPLHLAPHSGSGEGSNGRPSRGTPPISWSSSPRFESMNRWSACSKSGSGPTRPPTPFLDI